MNIPQTKKYDSNPSEQHENEIDRYFAIGLALIVFGFLFAEYAFLILISVPMTALGISCVILGATNILIPKSPIPSKAIRSMIQGSCLTIEVLLNQFNAEERCIYIRHKEDKVLAFIPLNANYDPSKTWQIREAPIRVVTEVGGDPALMVFPPISTDMLSLIGKSSRAEEALRKILVEKLEFIESIKEVESGSKVVINMHRSRVETDLPRFRKILGTIPTSLAGCILAYLFDKPLILIDEKMSGKVITATFEVMTKNE